MRSSTGWKKQGDALVAKKLPDISGYGTNPSEGRGPGIFRVRALKKKVMGMNSSAVFLEEWETIWTKNRLILSLFSLAI